MEVMVFKFNSKSTFSEAEVLELIKNFSSSGQLFGDGKRNKIKLFEIEGKITNIKSFKIPHLINSLAYNYFRKSKAQRSYEYAIKLQENNIGTPMPIAYYENKSIFGLKDSYYVSEHFSCDLTFRELVEIPNFPDRENIIRQMRSLY